MATISSVPPSPRRATRQEFLIFGAPVIGEEEIEELIETVRSGWIGFGPKCLQFEREFAEYAGAKEAVSLSSCTAGLHLALLVSGVGRGDEVITTPLTFAATANVIEHVGARPVFVDVDPVTQNIDADAIEAAVTPKSRAVIPVHMAGRPCDVDAIGTVAGRHGLKVIEDAAHAIEASYYGRKIGSTADFTAFSFYATKNLTTAEGGMLTTNDHAAAERLRTLRLHGITRDAWKRYSAESFKLYDTIEPGFKYNLTDLQASLGLHQLRRIESNLLRREQVWGRYDAAFGEFDSVEIPAAPSPGERHARHLYTLLLRPELLQVDRDGFIEQLRLRNIGSGVHFIPVHQHSYYRQRYGYAEGDFPNAEDIGRRTISLPLSAGLTDDDVEDVIAAVTDVLDSYAL